MGTKYYIRTVCPYCGKFNEEDIVEEWTFDERGFDTTMCLHCGKYFAVFQKMRFEYKTMENAIKWLEKNKKHFKYAEEVLKELKEDTRWANK